MGLIKGLIFDFDGLILDTEEPSYSAWAQIYSNHGVDLDIHSWAGSLGSSEARFNPVTHLEGLLNQKVDSAALRNTAQIVMDRVILEQPPLPGVVSTILSAQRLGLKLAVASSSPRSWVAGHLKRLDLFSFFNTIICMEDVPEVKPAPDLFLAALAGLGIQPQEAIIFEDSPNGIQAGKRAGIFSVAVPNAVSRQLDLSLADLILDRMDAIPLEQLAATAENYLVKIEV